MADIVIANTPRDGVVRSFVAVQITDDGIINSIRGIQSAIGASGRRVEPGNLHFTLQFLGEVSEDLLADVVQAIRSVRFSRFDVSLTGIGAFPSTRCPRTVWAGTDDAGGKMLTGLACNVRESLGSLGLTEDKPFRPHMTIFRIKKKAQDMTEELRRYEGVGIGTQSVGSISLMKSVLGPDGPVYSDLATVGVA